MKLIFCWLLWVCSVGHALAQLNAYKYNNTKNITVSHAAVVSAHALASDAGLQVLKKGGNAFDAAIATYFALAVVYPGAGNLGGGGFMVAHTSKGKNLALDFREMAPAKATRDMYLDAAGIPIANLSMEGTLASGVPGSVAGIFAILPYANLPLAALIDRAITLADKGFAVTDAQAADFNNLKESFEKNNKNAIAFVKTNAWRAGDILIQKELANTLKLIKKYGAKGFYEGITATHIVNEMKNGGGIISYADLKNYKVIDRSVMQFGYKNTQILTMPLPSSGGIILRQLLTITGDRKLGDMHFQSAEAVQLVTEAERRAFADRGAYMGDVDFVKVPVSTLVSKAYLDSRMADYNPTKAGSSKLTGQGQIPESEETTHISIIDQLDNAVSITTTLNNHFGSRTIISGAGFVMNNEMDDFSIKPGVPNMYGAIGNDKNAIAPGKRMLSSMTPTIVLKNNKPFMVVGSPGGTTIPTSVFQTIVNVIDYKMSPVDAVNKPKFHHQYLPDVIYVEKDFNKAIAEKLTNMGYIIEYRAPIGRTELIMIADTLVKPSIKFAKPVSQRVIYAVGDKRGNDDARGF